MKAICPFDKNHVLQADQLQNHILKCKSPNKLNFQQCKYDKSHWVNFSKIKEHEEQCSQPKLMSSNISMSDDSVLHQIVEALSFSQEDGIEAQIKSMIKQQSQKSMEMMKKNKKNDKKIQQTPKNKKWVQPNFKNWIMNNYSNNLLQRSLSSFEQM